MYKLWIMTPKAPVITHASSYKVPCTDCEHKKQGNGQFNGQAKETSMPNTDIIDTEQQCTFGTKNVCGRPGTDMPRINAALVDSAPQREVQLW